MFKLKRRFTEFFVNKVRHSFLAGLAIVVTAVGAVFFVIALVWGDAGFGWMLNTTQDADRLAGERSANVGQGSTHVRGKAAGQVSSAWFDVSSNSNNGYGNSGLIISMSSHDNPVVTVRGEHVSGQAEIKFYQADIDTVLRFLQHDERYSLTKEEGIDYEALQKLAEIDVSQSELSAGRQVVLPSGPNGFLLGRIEGKNAGQEEPTVREFVVVRADFGVFAAEEKDSLLFWGQMMQSGESIRSGKVGIYSLRDGVKEIASGVFGADGLARTDLEPTADLAVVESGGGVAFVPLNMKAVGTRWFNGGFAPYTDIRQTFMFSDRPLYGPGDKIYVKAYLRQRDDFSLKIPAGEQVRFVLKAGYLWDDHAELLEDKVAVSGFGSADTHFQLDEDFKVGQYVVILYAADGSVLRHIPIEVQNYTKPEYSMTLEPVEELVVKGQPIEFDLRAEYFSGQPLAGAEVDYTVRRSRYHGYYGYYGFGESYDGFMPYPDYLYGRWGSVQVGSGKALLDSEGRVRLMEQTESEDKWEGAYVYTVSATYSLPGMEPIMARGSVLVNDGAFRIETDRSVGRQNYYGVAVGEEVDLPIKVSGMSGQKIEGLSLTAKAERKWYEHIEKDGRKKWTRLTEEVTSEELVVSADGRAKFRFTAAKDGEYLVTVSGRDMYGNVVDSVFSYYVGDRGYWYGAGGSGDDQDNSLISLRLDKDSYQPGDTVTLEIMAQTEDQVVLLTTQRGYLHGAEQVRLQAGKATVTVKLNSEMMPNVYFGVHGFIDGKFSSDWEEAIISAKDKSLNVSLNSNKKVYGPGEEVTLTVTAEDSSGRPVDAELAVWAVDKALFELVDEAPLRIFQRFWSQLGNGTATSHSLKDITVMGAEMGGGDGEGDTRQDLEDMAYWNPTVRTGYDGQATVSFKLPDNLTTWVISGAGLTRDTKAGKAQSEIKVTRPAIVRPIVPDLLRAGDVVVMSAGMQNNDGESHDFQTSLETEVGTVELTREGTRHLKAGQTRFEYWNLWASAPGSGTLTYGMKAVGRSGLSDAVAMPIEVEPLGFDDRRVEVGRGDAEFTLRLPGNPADRESFKVSLNLANSVYGTLPEAGKYLVTYPWGCVEQTTSRFVPLTIAATHQELFEESVAGKNIDGMFDAGIRRLAELQSDNGSWDWWWHEDDNVFISAYVAEYLTKASDLGYDEADVLLEKSEKYFREIVDGETAVAEGDTPSKGLISATYGLYRMGKTQGLTPIDLSVWESVEPDLLALAVMANYGLGETDPNKNGLTTLVNSAEEGEEGGLHWRVGGPERLPSVHVSTALAIRAVVEAGSDRGFAERALAYLTDNRSSGRWSNSFATAQVMQAVADHHERYGHRSDVVYEVQVDGERLAEGSLGLKSQESLAIPIDMIDPAGSVLRVRLVDGVTLISTLRIEGFRTDLENAESSHGMKIRRQYDNVTHPNEPFRVGDVVEVTLTAFDVVDFGGNQVIVEDRIPAGLRPINSCFNNSDGASWRCNYQEFYPGRVSLPVSYLYRSWDNNSEYIYRYRARVIAEGAFSAPPARIEAMYKPEVYATSGFDVFRTGQFMD